jgi:glycosyltransferase A (GT-A) superfamily protein (DUF2064 family)
MELLVLAKEPRPGAVKTRLCPPCDPVLAATLAEAALRDTLVHAVASRADRVVLALDGSTGAWCPPGVDVVPQADGPLNRRLAAAWQAVRGPAIQIGMDTPQVGPDQLDAVMIALEQPDTDVVLGPALDGGWWVIGFRDPAEAAFAFDAVPMSRADTYVHQLARLRERSNAVQVVATQRDVDRWDDAVAVAQAGPGTHFAVAMRTHAAALAGGGAR